MNTWAGPTVTRTAACIRQTSNGGYIVAGSISSNGGNVWVVRLNSNGSVSWSKSLGGSGRDWANSIQQTKDGGYIFAGTSESNDGQVSGNHGKADVWVVKLNSTGTIVWQKCFGGSDYDHAYSVQQTIDGGYIVAGTTSSTNGNVKGNYGINDAWIIKLNSSGSIVWSKCLGGTGGDVAYSVQQTKDGGYIFTGYSDSTNGNVTGNHGNNDVWVVKLTSGGTTVLEQVPGRFRWRCGEVYPANG